MARQPPAKVEAGFHGDRKHAPTDARYAAEIAKADIARLKDKWELSSDERADINAKLKWFQGAAREAFGAAVKPTLHQILEPIDMSDDPEVQREHAEWRSDRKEDIVGLFNSIQKLKATRIDSWKENARLPESKLALAVLEAAIAIVSLGIGGVAYGLIEKMLEKSVAHKLLQEFVLLAGLEAADLAAEKAFHEAVELARADLETGRKRAQAKQKEDSMAALATKGDSIAAYTEAIRLQTITEETEEREAFNKVAKNMTDKELLAKYAALKLIYKQQLENPEPYIRPLLRSGGACRRALRTALAGCRLSHPGGACRTPHRPGALHCAMALP